MMTIYKERAIEVLAIEPLLIANTWFNIYTDKLNVNLKNCEVCAVGAVLREHCFTTKYSITQYNSSSRINSVCRHTYASHNFEKYFLKDETNYLGNLSMAFEWLAENGVKETSNEMRLSLISVIEATWPDQFTIDL